MSFCLLISQLYFPMNIVSPLQTLHSQFFGCSLPRPRCLFCTPVLLSHLTQGQPEDSTDREQEEHRLQHLGFLSSCFFLNRAGISKSLESILSLGPHPTGGGSSPPELRHARAVPQGPPGQRPCPPFASSSSQLSQSPREWPPGPKREPQQNHPMGTPGASKATIPSGGLLYDSEFQRRVMEVRSP